MADMIKHASYGRLALSRNKSKVVTVQMGMSWSDVINCRTGGFATLIQDQLEEKLKGQDPPTTRDSFNFLEMFFPREAPPNGDPETCGSWMGLGGRAGVGGCHFSRLPGAQCNAIYSTTHGSTRAHELGHNLGLLHASGPNSKCVYVEYGDPQSLMGNSYEFSSFIASARFQIGVLHVGPGEVVEWTETQIVWVTIQSISLPLNQSGADAVAIKLDCNTCVPKVEEYKYDVGGRALMGAVSW